MEINDPLGEIRSDRLRGAVMNLVMLASGNEPNNEWASVTTDPLFPVWVVDQLLEVDTVSADYVELLAFTLRGSMPGCDVALRDISLEAGQYCRSGLNDLYQAPGLLAAISKLLRADSMAGCRVDYAARLGDALAADPDATEADFRQLILCVIYDRVPGTPRNPAQVAA